MNDLATQLGQALNAATHLSSEEKTRWALLSSTMTQPEVVQLIKLLQSQSSKMEIFLNDLEDKLG